MATKTQKASVVSSTPSKFKGKSVVTLSNGQKIRVDNKESVSKAASRNQDDKRTKIDVGGNISAEEIGTVSKIEIPRVEPTMDYNSILSVGNAGLLPQTETQNQSQVSQPKSLTDSVKDFIGLYEQPVNQAKEYQKLEKQLGINDSQNQVNQFSSQLNAIQAKAQADQLSLTGQGRGVPEVIIGGQQAQVAKEAAIQALPVQAQLLAAQGNLQMAQQRLDTLFKLRVADAEAKTNQWNKMVDMAYDSFTRAEQNRLADIRAEKENNNSIVKDAINFQQSLAMEALKSGNGSTFSSLTSLTPPSSSDKNFEKKFADYNKQLALAGRGLAQGGTSGGTSGGTNVSAPTIKSINGVDMEWNPQTGTWTSPSGTVTEDKNLTRLASIKANVDNIESIIESPGLNSSVGTSFLSRKPRGLLGNVGAVSTVVGIPSVIGGTFRTLTGERQAFIGSVEQMRSGLNLDTLIKAKGQGATFGALSNQELQVLSSAATRIGTWAKTDEDGNIIGYNISEKEFKAEVAKINNFAKLDFILKGGDPQDVGAIIKSDGTVWADNKNGTFTQIR